MSASFLLLLLDYQIVSLFCFENKYTKNKRHYECREVALAAMIGCCRLLFSSTNFLPDLFIF